MLRDRIIFIGSGFTSDLANAVVAQLLFLEAEDKEKDIIMYINSPGGMVSACLAIYDTMNYIKPDVSTICIGEAASAAAFILGAGTKGKRFALNNSRIMLHQVSAGAEGHIEDMKRTFQEAERINDILLTEWSKMTGKTKDQMKLDMDRDYWFGPEDAIKYGIIDEVLINRE
jgi:ATP-dependent Clp protease protease subunit